MATHGTATIPAGSSYVVVQHTLGSISTSYKVATAPLDNLAGRNAFVTNKGVASFRMNISSKDASDHEIKWVIV